MEKKKAIEALNQAIRDIENGTNDGLVLLRAVDQGLRTDIYTIGYMVSPAEMGYMVKAILDTLLDPNHDLMRVSAGLDIVRDIVKEQVNKLSVIQNKFKH